MTNKEILKNLIEDSPLYNKIDFKDEFLFKDSDLNVIEYTCQQCNKLRPFHRTNVPPQRGSGFGKSPTSIGEPRLVSSTIAYSFQCTYCSEKINFWIELNTDDKWLRKVGQNPPWSIEIPTELKHYLQNNEELYKKGLICLSQSFGVGACSYFRRIIENEIDPLLELLIERKKIEGEDESKLKEYELTREGKSFTDKTKLAYEITPSTLIIDGLNPFKLLHDFLSHGIHSKNEDQCVEIATKTKGALEFVVIELNREKNSREKFKKSIKDIK